MPPEIADSDVSILINSCDKYADIWPVFFTLFWKNWPDCPYPVYLGTNMKTWDDERVHVLQVGPDISWADTTIKMVKMIPSKYILFFLDDFLIWEKVNTDEVVALVEKMKSLDIDYLRLRNWPPMYQPVDGYPDIVQVRSGTSYRCALEIAFWRRDVFLDLIVPGETPWEMEKIGSSRSNDLTGFYATRKNLFKRTNGLERGKWIRDNLAGLRRENIALPPGRDVMTTLEYIKYYIRTRIFWFLISCKGRLGLI